MHSPRSNSGATHANLLVAGITAGHFPTYISRCGTWLGFKWAITQMDFLIFFKISTIFCQVKIMVNLCPKIFCYAWALVFGILENFQEGVWKWNFMF